ncbi:unnamed protein product [Peronospora belbahrii]|uniref:Uncharacterized protein n=1 Tax=Peronospora belbahrii TaxID=622444 RepID=A0AAU9KUE3_9STRA|nr:unnamed protein product [Peronospora belbahrii]
MHWILPCLEHGVTFLFNVTDDAAGRQSSMTSCIAWRYHNIVFAFKCSSSANHLAPHLFKTTPIQLRRAYLCNFNAVSFFLRRVANYLAVEVLTTDRVLMLFYVLELDPMQTRMTVAFKIDKAPHAIARKTFKLSASGQRRRVTLLSP